MHPGRQRRRIESGELLERPLGDRAFLENPSSSLTKLSCLRVMEHEPVIVHRLDAGYFSEATYNTIVSESENTSYS